MHIDCLRKLRLLFEDFPKSHTLLLVAQPPLIHKLRLGINEDLRSRITYSVHLKPLAPDDVKTFILDQLFRQRGAGSMGAPLEDDQRGGRPRRGAGGWRR